MSLCWCPLSRLSIGDIRRRGLRRAGGAGLIAAGFQLLHGIGSDFPGAERRTGTHHPAVRGLVGAGLSLAAMGGRRWAARPLGACAILWAVGSIADHPAVFTHAGSVPTQTGSAARLGASLAAELAVVVWLVAPALPRRLDRLKAEPGTVDQAVGSGATLVDVRTAWERQRHPVPHALAAGLLHPERALGDEIGDVLVVCSHGGRSLVAAARLRRIGIEARSVAGGEAVLRTR